MFFHEKAILYVFKQDFYHFEHIFYVFEQDFIIFNIFRQNMKNYKKILLNSTPRTGLQIHCSQLKTHLNVTNVVISSLKVGY